MSFDQVVYRVEKGKCGVSKYRVEKRKCGVSRYRVEKGKCGVSFEISNKGRPPQDLRWGPYAVVEREHSTILCLLGMNVLCFLLYCFYVLYYLEFSKDVI